MSELLILMMLVFSVVPALWVGLGVLAVFAIKEKNEKKTLPKKDIDEQELEKAERVKRETMNMLSYSGDPQEEIHID